MVEHTIDVSGWLRKQLEDAPPDLLRAVPELREGNRLDRDREQASRRDNCNQLEQLALHDGYARRATASLGASVSKPVSAGPYPVSARSSARAATR